jgi:hypothetical protein
MGKQRQIIFFSAMSSRITSHVQRWRIKIGGRKKMNTDFVNLFNGSLDCWKMIGNGNFVIIFEDTEDQKQHPLLMTQGGMGLLWYYKKKFKDFILRLEWKASHIEDNSGIFVRFSDPRGDPWNAVYSGYEIQIDDLALPNKESVHKTGAIYGFMGPSKVASKPVGYWNNLYVSVKGQTYTVIINDEKVINSFHGNRSKEGYIGLQNHDDRSTVFFKNIFIKEI